MERKGLPVKVFTLYGQLREELPPEMAAFAPRVERLGLPGLPALAGDMLHWLRREPARTGALLREVPFRRWSCLEQTGENLWAFWCGFRLARRFLESGTEHIHAVWANGPATAAWVASRLTGIPFSFSARAGDIYPPDGALADKIRDCAYVRTNNRANLSHLGRVAPGREHKFHLVYNPLSLDDRQEAPAAMRPPYRLLAVGRFVRTKGFDVLLRACERLLGNGFDLRLTLAGSGPWEGRLKRLCAELGLEPETDFPGYVRHDRISALMAQADLLVAPSVIHTNSDRDGIPNVIMEALVHRLPVVASDVSGISEIVRHQETGLLVPERDPEALAGAIREMTADRSRALEMAEQGRSLVLSTFDPDQNLQRLIDLVAAHSAPAGRR